MADIKYLLFGLLSICPLYEAISTNLTCLKCDSVAQPTACKYIDRCGPHEVCSIVSTVTPIGSIVFKLGCIDKAFCGTRKRKVIEQADDVGTEICNECCTGDLCNAAGCGQTGFSPDLGPVCHFCDLHIGPSSCSEVKQCGRDQICELHPVKREGSHEDWYQSQCIHTNMCKGGQAISTQGSDQSTTDSCSVCCSTNVCNNQVPGQCNVIPVPTHDPVTSPGGHTTLAPSRSLYMSGNTNLCTQTILHHAHAYGGFLVQRGNYCYYHRKTTVSWDHAERLCQTSGGGHLFHIANEDDQKFFQNLMQLHGRNHPVWMGLNDKRTEEHFEWISGDPVTYTNWNPSRNSDFGSRNSEDCAVFIPALSGLWDDLPCGIDNRTVEDIGQQHMFICEYATKVAATHVTSQPAITNAPHVTSGHVITNSPTGCQFLSSAAAPREYMGSCYVYVHHQHVNWQLAENQCKAHNGHLVTIDNAEENKFIMQMVLPLHHNIWIGLSDQQQEDKFTWISGSQSTFRQFIPGYYHSNHDVRDCVRYTIGASTTGWDDSACTNKYRFICEIPSQTVHVPTGSPAGSLPVIYGDPSSCSQTTKDHAQKYHNILFGLSGTSHCYTLVKNSYHWSHANDFCAQNLYGHLADISDSNEQSQVKQFLNHYIPGQSVWIGLHRVGGTYKWTSGATSTYVNWNQDSHTSHQNNADTYLCVYMNGSTGKWSLGFCGGVQNPTGIQHDTHFFLCEMDHSGSLSTNAIVG